jgi:hypothetical protein
MMSLGKTPKLNSTVKRENTMQATYAAASSKTGLVRGHLLSGLAVLFLLADAVAKLFAPLPVVEATLDLGFREAHVPVLGIILLACLVVYLMPRTAVFGAVLLTGYLGGVEATHLRVGSDTFSFIFPLILAALLWGGLYLREARLRALVAPRNA